MKPLRNAFNMAQGHFQKFRTRLQKNEEGQEEAFPKKDSEGENEVLRVELSLLSVFKATLVVLGLILLGNILAEILDIFVLFLVALFFSAAFRPAVTFFEITIPVFLGKICKKLHLDAISTFCIKGIPRALSIVLVFVLFLGFLVFVASELIPVIKDQLIDIANSLEIWARDFILNGGGDSELEQRIHSLLSGMLERVNTETVVATISDNIESIANNLSDFTSKGIDILSTTLGVILNIFLVFLLTFFLILDRNNLNVFFHSLFPESYEGYLNQKVTLAQKKIGDWVHGQVILFFLVGGIAFIFFKLFGVPYALTLAMVFGIAEFVPYVGPAASFLVSAPIAFNVSTGTGIALLIFYVFLQFIEGNILVPMVMKRSVGLSPIATILALLVGASFPSIINPILGMILAVPVATILSLFLKDFTERKKNDDLEEEEEKA